jgi:galactokinase
MTDTIFRKNLVIRDYNNRRNPMEEGLEVLHRRETNNEDYVSVMGTKPQINRYLQEAPIISERLRTLDTVPMWRTFNTTKIRIQ